MSYQYIRFVDLMINGIILISSTFLFLLLLSCSNEKQVNNHIDAINIQYENWEKITNEKDIKKWSSFVAPEAVFLPPDSKPLESISEIKEYYLKLFEDPHFKLECNQIFVEVSESEDMAWSRGKCKGTFSSPDGTVGEGSSKWTKIWVKMADGSWKCKLNTWNSNQGN